MPRVARFTLLSLGVIGWDQEILWRPRPTSAFNDEDLQVAEQNVAEGRDPLSGIVESLGDTALYDVMAYVVAFANEFGCVGVRPCNGGLTRAY